MPTLRCGAVWTSLCLVLATGAPRAEAQGVTRTVPVGGDLQAVINAAAPGDTIVLPVGATFTGNFVLPAKTGTAFITIRSATDSRQPAPGIRVTPAHSPALARIQSPTSDPALRTAGAAHHYRLMLLEFRSNLQGYGEIVQLGQADSTQTSLSQVPYSLILDRVYIHGDPLDGQKRGIALNSADTQIINSYISDIKAIGQDSQAIAAMNGPGPYLIENNYLEAAAENFLTGGVDPQIPGLTPSDITVRYNHLAKPVAWKSPIMPTPTRVAAVAATGGTLPPGTYAYRVAAERLAGPTATARSAPAAEVTATTTDAAGAAVLVTWAPVANASSYRIYGRTPGGENQYWTTTTPSFTDTGAAGTAGTPGTGTVWTVKNIFELKNSRRVVVERNVIENNWQAAQAGYAIVLTPRNSGGQCTWCAVQDVTFRYNIVRHTASAINILGYDNGYPSGQARGIVFRDNLFCDVNNSAWGGNGWLALLGDGPADITLDHNTVDHAGTSIIYAYGTSVISGLQFTNNLTKHNTYGIFGSGATYGSAIIAKYFPDGVITANVLAGGSATKYPAGNLFPTVAYLTSQYVDPASGNYALVPGSSYATAALDGGPLGANIAEIMASAAKATAGNLGGALPALQLLTTTLPTGTVGQPFSAAMDASGGLAPYSWSMSGALPGGLQFDSSNGTLNGTPVEYGSWPTTVTVTDAASPMSSATRALTLSVRPTQVVILTTPLASQILGTSGATALQASGGTGSYAWRLLSGALPPGMGLDQASGTISGTPTAVGSFTFVVEAADTAYPDDAASATKSIVVNPPPVSIAAIAFPAGVQGTAYSAAASATGGAGPLVWSVSSGGLPTGLALDAATGTIAGIPSAAGSWTFTLRAVDSLYASNAATASFTIAIGASTPTLAIVTTSVPDAYRTIFYSTTLQATGGTGTLSWRLVGGTIPTTMTFSSDGTLSGKSGYYGYWWFTVEVRDSATPSVTARRQFLLMVRTKAGAKPPYPPPPPPPQ